ncbi:alpha/beta hydrolase-fold protein [Microbacterium sp. NPDC091313]
MKQWLLSFELLDSPVLLVCAILALVGGLLVLLVPPRRLIVTLAVGVAGGGAMFAVALALSAANTFDGPLPWPAPLWAAAAAAGVAVGAVGVLRRPWWRRLIGVFTIILALLAGSLGVNRAYGITHNLAAILGVQAEADAVLPGQSANPDDLSTLYQTWTPPADMPSKGTVGALTGSNRIPSGQFAPRDAALYLPPAALTADPPKLPLLVFMMGQPGSPDPTNLAQALDAFAAAHNGLAPIAIVADQLGGRDKDPACADSQMYGAVSTYFNDLIPQWASENLNISADHRYWIIGGYSNGGSCAVTWAAQHPDVWGQLWDISGNEFPGSEHVDETVKDVFGGDTAAFNAAKPAAIMAAAPAGTYDGHTAVFTWGGADTTFGPGQQSNAAAAKAAGFDVVTQSFDGQGHTGAVLDDGLTAAMAAIAPVVGLAAPAT